MDIAEQVYEQVKALSEPEAREVLAFIGYLHERDDLINAQSSSLSRIWNCEEDNIWNNE